MIYNYNYTGDDRLEVVARDFRVINSRGERLFVANRQEVVVGADILRVSGKLFRCVIYRSVYVIFVIFFFLKRDRRCRL